jgi:hypothetical protein
VHLHLRQVAHAVADHRFAIAQLALDQGGRFFQDVAGIEVRHEHLRLLGPQHQATPELGARQRLDQRIQGVVDFDEM